ncbi:helicase-associated domain-containing protein [Arthrobacter sp. Sr24]
MGSLQDFAASLADRSDSELLRLFSLRPDAITPPVANFADLASRLSTTASINLALDQLNLAQLRALSNVVRGGDSSHGAHGAELYSLHELALVLRTDSLLPSLFPSLKHDAGTLLVAPLAAVALALASEDSLLGSTLPDFAQAPQPRLTPVSPSMRDNAVGSAAETLLRTMNELLELVGGAGAGGSGLGVLRDGTLGVRPVRELSKALGLDTQSVNFHLELAGAAHLLTFDESARCWRANAPHSHAAKWSTLERTEQWLVLARAWLNSARPPSALLKPLAPYHPPRHARRWRRQLVSVTASLSAGASATNSAAPVSAAPDLDSVLAAMAWQHPRQTAALSHQLPALLHELEWLGITGAGALSSPGQAAARGDAALATAAMHALLPAPVENFVLQGDLTAIAPGFLDPAIASTLKLMAVPEGRGAAGIFRFSQRSLEFAAASGMSRTDVLDFLQQHSSTAVPQSLEFLIVEVFRNHPQAISTPPPTTPPSPPAARRQVAQQPEPGNGVVHEEAQALALAQLKGLRSQPIWANDGVGESGPALVMEELRRALGRADLLRVRVVDGAGEIEELLLWPVSLVAGTLRASLPDTTRERRLSIHRIISAAPERLEADRASAASTSATTTNTSTTRKERHG